MSDPTTVQDARSFLGKRQKLVDEFIGGDVEFVHAEILARKTILIVSRSPIFRVRCSEQTASQPLS